MECLDETKAASHLDVAVEHELRRSPLIARLALAVQVAQPRHESEGNVDTRKGRQSALGRRLAFGAF